MCRRSVEPYIPNSNAVKCVAQPSGDRKSREHGKDCSDCQCRSESADRTGSHNIKHSSRDQSSDLSVKNCGKRLVEAGLQRPIESYTGCQLFSYTRVNDDIRVHCHSYGQNQTRDTRQRKCQIKGVHEAEVKEGEDDQSPGGRHTRHPENDDHKQPHQQKSDDAGSNTRCQCLLTERRSDYVRVNLLQFQGQRTDTDEGRKLLCLLQGTHAGDLCLSAADFILYGRRAYRLTIVDNGNLLAYVRSGRLLEFLCSRACHRQINDILSRARALLRRGHTLCVRDIRTLEHRVAALVLECQGTRCSECVQNLIRVCDARNFDVDPVKTLLIYIRLGAVCGHPLLKFVDGVRHVLRGRIRFRRLICDADASGKIKSGPDILHCSCVVASPSEDYRISEKHGKNGCDNQHRYALFLFHLFFPLVTISFIKLPRLSSSRCCPRHPRERP